MGKQYYDDITGQVLDPALVRAARAKELEYFESKHVWELTELNKAMKNSGRKPISVRWVDVNNGDDEHPSVRSRLVAREIGSPCTESIFAPTPPPSPTLSSVVQFSWLTLACSWVRAKCLACPIRPTPCRVPTPAARPTTSYADTV